jgi:hypothetical protein
MEFFDECGDCRYAQTVSPITKGSEHALNLMHAIYEQNERLLIGQRAIQEKQETAMTQITDLQQAVSDQATLLQTFTGTLATDIAALEAEVTAAKAAGTLPDISAQITSIKATNAGLANAISQLNAAVPTTSPVNTTAPVTTPASSASGSSTAPVATPVSSTSGSSTTTTPPVSSASGSATPAA